LAIVLVPTIFNDESTRCLALSSRSIALGLHRPRRLRDIAIVLSFATTVRVVNWVHGGTTNGWADALPTVAAGLAFNAHIMLCVRYDAKRGATFFIYVSHFARWQANRGHSATSAHQLSRKSRRSYHFCPFSWNKFQIVNHRTYWHVLQS